MNPIKTILQAVNTPNVLTENIEYLVERQCKGIEILNEIKTYMFNKKVLDTLIKDIGDQHPQLKNSYASEIKRIDYLIKDLSNQYVTLLG